MFAEFESKEPVPGIARAKSEGKQLGRPRIAPASEERIRKALATPGRPGVRAIAKRFGIDPGTVQRISRPFECGASTGRGCSETLSCAGDHSRCREAARNREYRASHVSVEAISAVGARAQARWLRRIRTVRTDGQPTPTAGALAGAYGQAALHLHIEGRAAPFPVPSERAFSRYPTRKGRGESCKNKPRPEAARHAGEVLGDTTGQGSLSVLGDARTWRGKAPRPPRPRTGEGYDGHAQRLSANTGQSKPIVAPKRVKARVRLEPTNARAEFGRPPF